MVSNVRADHEVIHGFEPEKVLIWSSTSRETDVLVTDAVILYQKYLGPVDGNKIREEGSKITQAPIP